MINHSSLLESFWGEVFKIAVYIQNKAPSKAVTKPPYKLRIGKKPNIRHLHVWGCPAETLPYRPNEKKNDSRTVRCYFIGYSERSRGFKFYDPSSRFFFEMGNVKFPEDVEFRREGVDKVKDIVFEEEIISFPTVDIENDQTLPTVAVENDQAPNA